MPLYRGNNALTRRRLAETELTEEINDLEDRLADARRRPLAGACGDLDAAMDRLEALREDLRRLQGLPL